MENGFIQLHDTDVWEDRKTKITYNPIKVIARFNKEDSIVLKNTDTKEEIEVKLKIFKNQYDRVEIGKEYTNIFGI